jgi:superfamily I DNA/RNA helicase
MEMTTALTTTLLSEEQQRSVEMIVEAAKIQEKEEDCNTQTTQGNWVPRRPQQCLLMQAVAGSGKSSTLLAMTRALQDGEGSKRVLLLAFNTQMAATLKARVKENNSSTTTELDVFTLHSYGLHLLRRGGDPPPEVEPNKMYRIACALLQRRGLALDDWHDIRGKVDSIRHRGDVIDFEREPRPMALHLSILHEMLQERANIDQEEQIYHCLAFDIRLDWRQPYDVVLVDEAQDLNMSSILFFETLRAGPELGALCGGRFPAGHLCIPRRHAEQHAGDSAELPARAAVPHRVVPLSASCGLFGLPSQSTQPGQPKTNK